MTDTQLDVEVIEHLDFHEARKCEHSAHGKRPTHKDGGEVFVLLLKPCGCVARKRVVVFCAAFLADPMPVMCPECEAITEKADTYTVLGPANEP